MYSLACRTPGLIPWPQWEYSVFVITRLEKRIVGSADTSRTAAAALVAAREVGKESSPRVRHAVFAWSPKDSSAAVAALRRLEASQATGQ